MKRRLVIFITVIMLIVAVFSGCAGKQGDSVSGDKTATGSSPTGSPISSGGEDEELTWETADLSWKKDTSPVTFSIFIDFTWYLVDTWGKDDVSKEITKRTGVSLDVTKANDPTQIQVLLAGGELPDIVFVARNVERFHDPDICYRWDELIEQYCPEFIKLVDPKEIVNNTAADGHIYTFKTHFNDDKAWNDPRNLPSPGASGFHYRKDIVEKLGNPPLKSLDDLVNIFAMVKEKYPDMTVYIPHPTWPTPYLDWMGFFTPDSKYADNGKVYLGISQPGLVEYYKFFNKLYREGYMSMEALAYQPEQFFQIVRSGKAFSANYNTGLSDETNKVFKEQNVDGMFEPIMGPLEVDGKIKYKVLQSAAGWASCFITKNCKNPGRAIRFMEFLKSPEGDRLTQWGIEGVHYTLDEEGLLVRPEGFADIPTQEHGAGACWYFQASGLGEGITIASDPAYPLRAKLLKAIKPYCVRDIGLNFVQPVADSEEMNILVKITELITNTQPKMYGASTEEEAVTLFEKMLQDAEKLGQKRLEEYMTTKYNDAMKMLQEIKY